MLNTRKIAIAAALLKQGGVIVYPTEAVWGVGCDPQNHKAVMRLLAMKNREWQKGLILIASDIEQVEPYIDMPSRMAWRRATATWPGASTWVFPATDYCPMWISGERSTVAVRVTAHPLAARLCDEFGGAIVSTSANRAGDPPARSASDARIALRNRFDLLVPGALGGLDQPTIIRDSANGNILRR
ncbi:L-threonylcarbamoyladenylate synthase [Nevskia ramosa]|uniref:L-threonylcarbamoyladenylate synthase n=1 Tax=Nevskia ramosa TaxID=64002 RepID=UPI0003B57454|nr:Sua5/YciO/YrdC/YwlC family protein [Nevskia ramosa]